MNPIEKAKTWIDVLLDNMRSKGDIRAAGTGKHHKGKTLGPNAREERRLHNKRQRQARRANWRS